MHVEVLHAGGRVGAPGATAEFAAGESGRHTDHSHFGRSQFGIDGRTVGGHTLMKTIELCRFGDVLGEAQLNHLPCVDHRAAADADEEVGSGGAYLRGHFNHGAAWHVLRQAFAHTGQPIAQVFIDLFQQGRGVGE